jgi:hypothetical protein
MVSMVLQVHKVLKALLEHPGLQVHKVRREIQAMRRQSQAHQVRQAPTVCKVILGPQGPHRRSRAHKDLQELKARLVQTVQQAQRVRTQTSQGLQEQQVPKDQ